MVEASVDTGAVGNSSADGPLVAAARGVEKGVERTVSAAKDGLHKAKDGVDHAKDRVSEQASRAKDRVSEQATRAKDGMKELPNKSIGELADSVTDYAKEHPGQTILVSLGVGALLGMLLSRR